MFFLLFKRPNFACIFRTNCWPRRRARPANRLILCQPSRFTTKFEIISKRWRRLTPPSRRFHPNASAFGLAKSRLEMTKFSQTLSKRTCAKIFIFSYSKFVFKQLKWRNRWTQLEIAFNCPIAPLKKATSIITESNINITKSVRQKQEELCIIKNMIRKIIIDSILHQTDKDQAFENEALATFVEGEITSKLLNILTEQDIRKLEKLNEEEITNYLTSKIPGLNKLITEEVEKAKEKFRIKKQPVV